jgi:hypothetical protein
MSEGNQGGHSCCGREKEVPYRVKVNRADTVTAVGKVTRIVHSARACVFSKIQNKQTTAMATNTQTET